MTNTAEPCTCGSHDCTYYHFNRIPGLDPWALLRRVSETMGMTGRYETDQLLKEIGLAIRTLDGEDR